MRGLYLLLFLALVVNVAFAQPNTDDYRSATTGPWNQASTWERFNGSTWVAAPGFPTSANGIITIMDGTEVNVPNGASITADQIEYENNLGGSTGVLTVDAGGTLTIANGPSGADIRFLNDFTTLALLQVSGTVVLQAGATMVDDDYGNLGIGPSPVTSDTYKILAGGTHVHTTGSGVDAIPAADYQDGSTCRVDAGAAGAPTIDAAISFYNFTWNGTAQAALMDLLGGIRTVRNDLIINGTAAPATTGNILRLGSGVSYTLSVGRDLIVTANSRVQFNVNGVVSFLIGRNLDISSTSSQTNAISFNATGTSTFTITGDFLKSNVSATTLLAGTSGSTPVNLEGNFSITGGSVLRSATGGSAVFNFTGTSTRTFTNTGTISGPVGFNITVGKTLDMGTSAITGTGSFALRAGATLRVGSADGLVTGSTLGNIRTTGTRTYEANSNIVYSGNVGQSLGNEWSATGALSGIAVNLEIDNSSLAGITNNVAGSTNVVGNLTLTNGILKIGNANALNIKSNFTATNGTIGGDPAGTLIFSGSGTITGTLGFASGLRTLKTFQLDRAADVVLGTALTMSSTGSLQFTASGNLRINGQTLTINGDITQTSSGGITSLVNTSRLVIGGSGALTSLPLTTGSLFKAVILSRTGGSAYTWNSTATISDTLNLQAGTFTHSSGLTMATGSTFARSAGTTYSGSTPNATTRYSLSYTGTVATSSEMPTTALNRLENLTTNGDVTLDKSIIINGDLNINAGKLSAGAHNVTVLGANFLINGGTFDIASTNSVTFSRAGTTVIGGSTVNDAQFGTFVISSGTTVTAPAANINISNTWTNGGTFNPNNGTVTFNGTTQSINANGQPFYNLTTSGGTKTLTGALDVNGTLNIGSGSTLAAGSNTINIAGTWDNNGTFSAGTGTVIFDGAAQTIDNSGQSFNALTLSGTGTKTLGAALDANGLLTISSGVTLDVTASNYNINAGGNWVNNGTFNARNGTVIFDAGIIQTVGGSSVTAFYNITNLNASTLTMSTDQTLTNALSLQAGTFNPNGHFTLLSSASGDARIDQLTGGATISATNMTVQRYLPNTAGVSVARYLSSPVNTVMLSQWKDDFPITGPISDHSTNAEWAGQGLPTFNETGSSIQVYNEPKGGNIDLRYDGFPLTGTIATTPLVAGVGYNVRPRFTTPLNLELVGHANFGNVSVTVTAQGTTNDDGWNLVGNPYPSPINWNNVTRPGGLSTQIALKDNTNNIGLGAGQYVYYTAGGPGIPASYTGTIAQGQAFWVRKLTAGSATLTFQEDDKQATSTPPFMRQSEENILRIHVTGNNNHDELVITFSDDAQDIYEGDRDAYKLKNSTINFSSLTTDNLDMAINTFGALSCSREIPLTLNNVTPGAHKFTFSQLESFAAGIDVRLLDNFTGQTSVITDANTEYNFDVTSDAATFGTGRFKVYIGYKDINLASGVQGVDACNGSDAQIKITSAQPGVSYYATVNGTSVSDKFIATGTDLTINIPTANLVSDESTIVLKAQNGSCAEMPLTQSAIVKKNGAPAVSDVEGATSCGEGSVTLTATGAPTDGSYKWYLTEDATDAIEGQTASSFTTPSLSKTKTYFVSAVAAAGCEGERVPVTATVSYVDQATITIDGDNLVSNADSGNQWYLDGILIPGATGKTYKPTEAGTYRLVVTTGTCSSQVEKEFAITGDINDSNLKGYSLYPNPSSGLFYVEVPTTSQVAVSVVNGVGTEITRTELKQEGNSRRGQIDISGRAAGLYLVVIKHDQKTVTRKIVKN